MADNNKNICKNKKTDLTEPNQYNNWLKSANNITA